MSSASHLRRLPLAIAALLLLLLGALASLQWRWLGELSDMERQRLQANLQATGTRFAQDFDRELTRVLLYFHPERQDAAPDRLQRIADQYAKWETEAPFPGLVQSVYLVRPGDSGSNAGLSDDPSHPSPPSPPSQRLTLEALQPPAHRPVAVGWPAELAAVRQRLEVELRGAASGPSPGGPFARLRGLAADLPGIVFPLAFPPPAARGEARDPLAGAVLLVRLDREVIAKEILPALMRRHFGSAEGDEYAVAVAAGDDPTHAKFLSDPAVPLPDFAQPDARVEMFGLRPFEELRGALPDHRAGSHGHRPWETLTPAWPHLAFAAREGHHAASGWTLLIKRRDGSLEQAVAAARRRNLGISVGILGLIAITVVTLALSVQRAQRLARQQMEFVAGVTHELHTPLAAIRSAGENLADGVVAHPEQVRRYGALVEREGRRLSDMVGQILEFAGIQSGRRSYAADPVAIADVVAAAMAESRWLLDSNRLVVEQHVASDLPPVTGDATALRRAVKNLIENAIKHGGAGGWIRVSAARVPPDEVTITVADRGPGVRRDELPHLFEPFFRGREAAAQAVPGAGLGLSLVRHILAAHGGRVTVDSVAGGGAAFTLHLPAAARAVVLAPAERPA